MNDQWNADILMAENILGSSVEAIYFVQVSGTNKTHYMYYATMYISLWVSIGVTTHVA